MKRKKIFSWLVVATIIFSNVTITPNFTETAYAATTEGDFSLNGDTLTIKSGSDVIDLQVCTSYILRVDYKPGGKTDDDTEVLDPNQKWGKGEIIKSDLKSDPAVIETEDMIVKIDKSSLSLSVYDSSNGLLLKQDKLSAKDISFTHDSGENFYGISGYGCGTNADDGALRNNVSTGVTCGSQGYSGGPLVWSNGGYGLVVDSDGGTIATGDTTLSYSGISKADAEYFIIVGDPEKIAKGVSEVSGKTPMYPKWAMGFTNTQWGWPGSGTAEDQVKEVIKTYRSKNIPIDNFCFDFDWKEWGKLSDYGEFTWDASEFPSAPTGELKKWQAENGIHFTGIIKPRIFTGKEKGTPTAEYSDAKAGNFIATYAKTGGDYCSNKDYVSAGLSTQAARDWWWKCTEGAFKNGLYGYWNDEVDIENGFHNFDNLYLQKAQYEGQRKYSEDKTRVWSINRNFYLGAQKYGYGIWTGDIDTGFPVMKGQAGKMIAAINLGQNKWGMDTCGFKGDPNDENYARWIEFSAFTPIFRVHGQNTEAKGTHAKYDGADVGLGTKTRYPWSYNATAEAAAKNAMQLRYRLIPYIYKYEHDSFVGGTGIVKPLMMQYPNDPKVAKEVYSWMFGDYMLVSPVLDAGQTEKEIYLPAGKWIDYSNGKEYDGGQTVKVATDATTWKDIPIFVKQGAIIPTQQDVNYIGEKKIENINLDVFPSAKESSFDYYDDDGESYDYEDGSAFYQQKLSVSSNSDGDGVSFKTGKKEGTYTGDLKTYTVKLHVKNAGAVTCNGKALTKSDATVANFDSAKAGTYAVGEDTYGGAVYIKLAAGEINTVDVKCDVPSVPESSATLYAKTSAGSADLEYSLDGGSKWEKVASMTQSTTAGYLEGDFEYKAVAEKIMVRLNEDGTYFPSKSGVELDTSKDKFTIGKDGKVKNGAPSVTNATIYISSDSTRPVIQYKDDIGWSDVIPLSKYGAKDGQYSKGIAYDSDSSSVNVRYSIDNGKTWLPSDDGAKVTSGDFTGESGDITSGRPAWDNIVTLYYKGNCTHAYWKPLGGAETDWSAKPGTEMTESEISGYKKVEMNVKTAAGAEVCFNINGGSWDSNGQKNYKTGLGSCTYEGGAIKSGDPNGNGAISGGGSTDAGVIYVSSSVRGTTYATAQKLKLTASDSSASIYYTLDGTDPTEKSTEYSDAIDISKTTTVKSIAIDSKGNKSAINTQKYVIDPNGKPPVEEEYEELKSVTLSAGSTVTLGKSVKLSASCNTDNPDVKYEFGYYDSDNEWNVISKYSSKDNCDFTPDKEGKYNVCVKAKTSDSDEVESNSKTITASKTETTDYEDLESATLALSSTKIIVGKSVKLTASSNTDNPDVKYEFGYYDSSDKWHQIQAYSSETSCTFTPKSEGTFACVVKAKTNDKDEVESNSKSLSVSKATGEETSKFTSVQVEANKTSVTVQGEVDLSATPDYDDGSIKYEFGYKDEDNNWHKISTSSSSNEYTWTPDEAGTYNVCVKATSQDTSLKVYSDTVKIVVKDDGSSNNKPTADTRNVGIVILASLASIMAIYKSKKRRV